MMPRPTLILPVLFLAGALRAQAPAVEAPAPGAAAVQAPTAPAQGQAPASAQATAQTPAAPAPRPLLRAQYAWGFAGGRDQGKGTLAVLIEPATGRTVLEIQGLGERLALLEGDRATGYRVQIPRQKVDVRAASLAGIPLPFFPELGSADQLYQLLADGTAAGVQVTQRDASGPVKLRYQGTDAKGKDLTVWLERTRWEPAVN
jgi:hypothetical protein